ncbi:hypothetical protein V5799_003481 [Amblyomma americanum]|uniref:G-protein coupled receptors family 1 profile domain-containing protein n=1 Tax=Amblyomma americanum TaxID=6943 RepID=A0AAQ4D8U8_AMBAM
MNATTTASPLAAHLDYGLCNNYWFALPFQAVVVGVTSVGAAVSVVMAVALLRSPAVADRLSPRLLGGTCVTALTLSAASLATPAIQLSGKEPGYVECVVTGSLYLSSVQTMAFYLICLNVDEYMLVLHCGSPHRKWMDHVFSVAPWLLSWAITIPHAVEYWGCFRPNNITGHCTVQGPWSTRVVNGVATVLVPVGVTAFIYALLMVYVLSERNKSCQPLTETSMPRFIQVTSSRYSSQKLERDLSSLLFVISFVCTFYVGYLPYMIIESYFLEEFML